MGARRWPRAGAVAALAWVTATTACGAAGGRSAVSGELVGIEWSLREMRTPDGVEANPSDVDVVLRFDGKGHASGRDGCNYLYADVRADGDRLNFGPQWQTTAALCEGERYEPGKALYRALGSGPTWRLVDGRFLITTPDGTTAVLVERESIYPMKDARSVVEGEHKGGQYRVAWGGGHGDGGGDGNLWLRAEVRDAPGTPWGTAGASAEPAAADAMALPLAGDTLLFGSVVAGATRVAYHPPDGGPAVDLALHRLGDTGHSAFTGIVLGPRQNGGTVVHSDAAGRELARHPLRG